MSERVFVYVCVCVTLRLNPAYPRNENGTLRRRLTSSTRDGQRAPAPAWLVAPSHERAICPDFGDTFAIAGSTKLEE